jgi:hypothetical protein
MVCHSRSLVFCVVFCRLLFAFCPFSFEHCVVCPSSINGFWLSLLVSSNWTLSSNKHSSKIDYKRKRSYLQKTNNGQQNTTQKTKDRVTRTRQKTNKGQQNTTLKTKDRVTRTPQKTNNGQQNTTQKTKDRVTRTPQKTNNGQQNTTLKTFSVLCFVDHCLFFVGFVLLDL